MQQASFDGLERILCLGAHADDIEIGCGGTILKLCSAFNRLEVMWVVFSAEGDRRSEAYAGARTFLRGAGRRRVVVNKFRGSLFPFDGERIKECFETLKPYQPDVVFVHRREDLHQDHRLLCEFAWNTFRSHLILEYEIPKYDGDLGCPNVFVQLDRRLALRKTRNILRLFRTQSGRHWFSEDTFMGLMRLRGIESASPGGFAEGFYCRKLVIGVR